MKDRLAMIILTATISECYALTVSNRKTFSPHAEMPIRRATGRYQCTQCKAVEPPFADILTLDPHSGYAWGSFLGHNLCFDLPQVAAHMAITLEQWL
jgi:hypothetical protein